MSFSYNSSLFPILKTQLSIKEIQDIKNNRYKDINTKFCQYELFLFLSELMDVYRKYSKFINEKDENYFRDCYIFIRYIVCSINHNMKFFKSNESIYNFIINKCMYLKLLKNFEDLKTITNNIIENLDDRTINNDYTNFIKVIDNVDLFLKKITRELMCRC